MKNEDNAGVSPVAQYTPGPWLAEHGEMSLGAQRNTSHVVSLDLKENDGWAVATVHGPANKANARLIASAPELLAALRLVRDELRYKYGVSNEVFNAVDEAIAKAEGRTL